MLAVPTGAQLGISLVNADVSDARVELGLARTDSASDLALAYRILWGTELATNDVLNPEGRVRFAAGETDKLFTVELIRDGRVEPAKSLSIHVESVGVLPPQSTSLSIALFGAQEAGGWDYSFPFIPDVSAFALLEDESLIVFHGGPTRISRFDSAGKPFPNYGSFTRESVSPDITAHLLPNGAILIGGSSGRTLLKIDASGAIDPGFPLVSGMFVAFQSTGSSLARVDSTLVRHLPDGQRDATFRDIPRVHSAAVLKDDRLVATVSSADGTHGELFRYNSNGERIDAAPLVKAFWADLVAMDDGGFVIHGWIERDSQRTNVIARWDAVGNALWERPRRGDLLLQHRNELFLLVSDARYLEPNLARLDANGDMHTDFFVAPPFARLTPVAFGETIYARRRVAWPYRQGDLGRVFLRNKERSEVTFAESIINLPEKGGGAVTLKRVGDASEGATFSVATAGPVGETLTHEARVAFAPLEKEKMIVVGVQDDNLPERDSSTRMELREITGALAGEFAAAEWRVVDDDGRPGNIENGPGRWELPWREPLARVMLELQDGRILVTGSTPDWEEGYQYFHSFTAEGLREEVRFDHQSTNSMSRSAYALGQQSTGKIVVSGEFREGPGCLSRVNPDGTRDATFSVARTYTCHGVYVLAIQADDRILVGGSMTEQATGNGLVRLMPDGGQDRSFVLAPDQIGGVKSIVVQPDGKILIFGASRLLGGHFLMRILPSGAHDAGFEPSRVVANSMLVSPVVALQHDGKILASDSEYLPPRTAVVRLLPNGARDESFALAENPDGLVRDIFVQADGKIILGGLFTRVGGVNRNRVARLLPNGEVDLGFDPGVGGDISRLLLLRNGDILAGGSFSTFNGMRAAGLAYIRTSLDLLFLNPTTENGLLRAIVTGYPGTEALVEASSDFISWDEVAARQFDDYTAPIAAPADGGWMFLRARSR